MFAVNLKYHVSHRFRSSYLRYVMTSYWYLRRGLLDPRNDAARRNPYIHYRYID